MLGISQLNQRQFLTQTKVFIHKDHMNFKHFMKKALYVTQLTDKTHYLL